MNEQFEKLQQKFPELSTFVIFERLVEGLNLKEDKISLWFNKLVSKDDWMGCSKSNLITWLVAVSDESIKKAMKVLK